METLGLVNYIFQKRGFDVINTAVAVHKCNRILYFQIQCALHCVEIDLQYKHLGLEMGFKRFERMASLNDGKDFIMVLADLVVQMTGGGPAEGGS